MRKLSECKNFFEDLFLDCMEADAMDKSIMDCYEKNRYDTFCDILRFIYGQEFEAVRPSWAQAALNKFYSMKAEEAETKEMTRSPERQYTNIRIARIYAAEEVAEAIRKSHYSDADKGTMYQIIGVKELMDAYQIYRDADTMVREVFQDLVESVCGSVGFQEDDIHAAKLIAKDSYATPIRQDANIRVIRSYAPYRVADAVRKIRYSGADKKNNA